MLSETELANKLHDALGQKVDGEGLPTEPSAETQEYASGIVAALKAAIVSNLPGTINGVTAAGGPLSAGTGLGGLMVITPGPMLAKTANGFAPPGPTLSSENSAVITYIGTGLVSFAPGNITGQCTSTPVSPGPLANGAGTGGTILGLTGAGCAAAVAAATGSSGPDALKHYTALIEYISDNAEVEYASGSVVGVCPPGGGPLTAGAGIGGTIT